MRSPVVVTGAAGNLGSRLVPWLESRGRHVVPVDLIPMDHPGAVVDDLTEIRDRPWMSGAQAIVHLAGVGDATASWGRVAAPNVTSTRRVIDAAVVHGVERLVLASSVWAARDLWEAGGVVGCGPARPGDRAYGRSKAEAEALVGGAGISSVVLRIGGRVRGDAPAIRIDDWEDACWLGWDDFLHGVEHALDAAVDGVATVNLVSANAAGRWSLVEANDLIGFTPRQSFDPRPRGGRLRRVAGRLLHRR